MASASKVAVFLAHHIDRSSKSQKEIADEAGFERPNIISMLKQGITKLPVTRAPALARAIDVDPTELFRMCMEEYMPDLLKICDEAYAREKLTDFERQTVQRIRALTPKGKTLRFSAKAKDAIDDLMTVIS